MYFTAQHRERELDSDARIAIGWAALYGLGWLFLCKANDYARNGQLFVPGQVLWNDVLCGATHTYIIH